MNTTEKTIALLAAGYTIGQRDPRVNTNYPGSHMVIESHEQSELPTEDGRNGPWAVVGDDLWKLVDAAWDTYQTMIT